MRTIIGLDISKSTAKLSVACDSKTVYNGEITLDIIGFTSLNNIMKSYGGAEVVFKATGVYSRRLEKYLLDQGIKYHMLNPLVAKKRLDDGSRLRKNDVRDAKGLALTEFVKQPEPYQSRFYDPVYRELMDLSRYYDQQTEDLKRERNRVKRLIHLSFPGIEDELDFETDSALAVLRCFPHPARLNDLELSDIQAQIQALHLRGVGPVRSRKLAKGLWKARARSYPAVDAHSSIVEQLQLRLGNVLELVAGKEASIQNMVSLSRRLPEYEILRSIPSVGENTAVRIIGELGDIRRFDKRSQLNSFIGIDLTEIQSGDSTAQQTITKHGNPHARKLLYWTVVNMVNRTAKPNHIRDFYRKRQGSASRNKTLLVACVDRLIKTVLYLIKTSQLYSYELAGS